MTLPSIEAAFRSAFSWTLVALFGGKRRLPPPDFDACPYTVLFIRDDGVGDLVVSIEVLRAIAESHRTITLDLLCSPQNAALARTLPFVHDVIVHKRASLPETWPTWRRLRRHHYDVVIDGRIAINNVNKHTTALMLSTGAPWRIGVTWPGRTNVGVYSVPIRMERVPHWVDAIVALAGPFGIRPDSRDWRARIPLPAEERAAAEQRWAQAGSGRPRVLVNLYSASSDRAWPVERFVPVLARLRERLPGATIAIPTMPSGDAASDRLAEPVGAETVPLDLKQLVGFTAAADLLVSPLTGITHIAAAFNVPVLSLMRRDMEQWVPYRAHSHSVYSDDPRSLRPLSAERVVAGLDRLVDELGATRGWF